MRRDGYKSEAEMWNDFWKKYLREIYAQELWRAKSGRKGVRMIFGGVENSTQFDDVKGESPLWAQRWRMRDEARKSIDATKRPSRSFRDPARLSRALSERRLTKYDIIVLLRPALNKWACQHIEWQTVERMKTTAAKRKRLATARSTGSEISGERKRDDDANDSERQWRNYATQAGEKQRGRGRQLMRDDRRRRWRRKADKGEHPVSGAPRKIVFIHRRERILYISEYLWRFRRYPLYPPDEGSGRRLLYSFANNIFILSLFHAWRARGSIIILLFMDVCA